MFEPTVYMSRWPFRPPILVSTRLPRQQSRARGFSVAYSSSTWKRLSRIGIVVLQRAVRASQDHLVPRVVVVAKRVQAMRVGVNCFCPSVCADARDTPCRHSRVRMRHSCRAGGRPGGLPSRRLPASRTTCRRSWRAPTPGWRSARVRGAPSGTVVHRRSRPVAVGVRRAGVVLAPCVGSVPLRRRSAPPGIARSRTLPASG
jgi:hypothetical protein